MSSDQYSSLNLGLHVADNSNNVIKNRKLVVNLFGNDLEDLVAGEQVHGSNIKVVTEKNCGQGAREYKTSLSQTDALITTEKGVLLSSYYADCTPLFFLAPDIPAVGLAHAGWKGTVNKIGQKTVLKMKEKFDINISELLVGIGPHIGLCCYQVGENVIDKLAESFTKWRSLLQKQEGDKWKLDLTKANLMQLQEIGVKNKNIISSDLCTSCEEDLFYSYRRDNGRTGRMASLIKIR
ncbi:YfiH family protein [Halanaerobacter jeridensis]|uniref:Purine nucleoside phosphorylase n=1 Tax=Halanaerobacter jeridensis TaxID=706427 RepID=A0A938XUF4_9FIRM|nr:YfiH family protein [Halanaerobacter jeridensis]